MPKAYHIAGHGTFDFPDTMSDEDIREYVDNELRRQRQAKISYGVVPDVLMGATRGFANVAGGGIAGLADIVGLDSVGDVARKAVKAADERFLGFGPEMPGGMAADAGALLGGVAGFYTPGGALRGLGYAPKIAKAATSLLGIGTGLEEQRERRLGARAEGQTLTPWDEAISRVGGAALGAAEALPVERFLGRVVGPGMKMLGRTGDDVLGVAEKALANQGWRGVASEGLAQAFPEALQEMGSQAGQNLIEQMYNPERFDAAGNKIGGRGTWEGVMEGGLAGAGIGGLLGGAGAYANRRIARRYETEIAQQQDALKKLEEAAAALGTTSPVSTVDDISGVEIPSPEEHLRRVAEATGTQPPPSSVAEEIGMKKMGGDMSDAIVGNMYDMLWKKVEAGDTTEAGAPSLLLEVAQNLRSKGGLQTPEAFRSFAQDFAANLDRSNFADSVRALQSRHVPVAGAAAAVEPAPAPAAEPEDPFFAQLQTFLGERLGKYKLDQAFGLNLLRDLRTGSGEQAEGRYVPGSRKLEILYQSRKEGESVEDWQERIGGILDHEVIHGLKEAGVFTPEQWGTLLRRARKAGKVAEAQKAYAGMPGYNQSTFEEEGVAYVMQDSAGRRAPDAFMRRMWERVTGTFDRVGNAFRGYGWQNANDVMADIRAGRIGQRVQDVDAREAAKRAAGIPSAPESEIAAPVAPVAAAPGRPAPVESPRDRMIRQDAEFRRARRGTGISPFPPPPSLLDQVMDRPMAADGAEATELEDVTQRLRDIAANPGETTPAEFRALVERRNRLLRNEPEPPPAEAAPVLPPVAPPPLPAELLEQALDRPAHADPADPRTLAAVTQRLQDIAANPGDTTPQEFRRLVALREKLMSPEPPRLTNTEWQTLDEIAPRIRPTPGRPAPLPVAAPVEPEPQAPPPPLPRPAPPPLAPPPPPPKPRPLVRKAREKAAEVRAELDQIAKELTPAPDAATVAFEEDLARIREAKATAAPAPPAALPAPRAAAPDPAQMTGGQINKELDSLDAKGSALNEEFIAAGRGNQKPSEIMRMNDPLAQQYVEISSRKAALRNEVAQRYGPGAPSRLPKGFSRREAAPPQPIPPPIKQPPPMPAAAPKPAVPEQTLSASAAFKKAVGDFAKASDSLAFLESNRGKAGVDQDKLEADIAAAARQVERVKVEYESAAQRVEAQQAAENPRAKPKSKLHEVMGQAPPPAATPTQLPPAQAPSKQRYMVNRWWQSETGPEGRAPDGYTVTDTETGQTIGPYANKAVAEKQAARMAKVAEAQGPQPLYAMRRPGRKPERDTITHRSEMATRVPRAVGATEDALGDTLLTTSYDSAKNEPNVLRKNVNTLRKALNFRDIRERDPLAAAEQIIERMVETLTWLHNKMPEDMRNRAKLWYDGANKIAKQFSQQHGVETDQASGVLAVFSPQKDWFQNVGMAERMLDFWAKKDTLEWDPRMVAVFRRMRAAKDKTDKKRAERKGLEWKSTPGTLGKSFRAIRGKRFSEITDPHHQAVWFRMYEEAVNPREYQVVTPEGDFSGIAMKKDRKTPARLAWSSFSPIKKAMSILQDGSYENIHANIGNEHKVRNFYNNILVPNSPNGHVTMDTHAVAAALMRALSGKSREVAQNFGGGGSSSSSFSGNSGTYPIIAEAYRRAAKGLKTGEILPREMQSITWEAIRGLFQPGFKGQKKNVKAIDNIWKQVSQGKITRAEAYDKIHEAAGGITDPDWYERPNAEVHGGSGNTAQPGDVSGTRSAGRGPGRVSGSGDRGAVPGGIPAPGLLEGTRRVAAPKYALPRPRPNSLASQIVDSAAAIRAGRPVSIQDPADRQMAERLAANSNVDLEQLHEDRPDLNFDKLEMEDRDKEHLRLNIGLARQALGPHVPFTFDRLKAISNKLVGSSDFLESDIQKLKERGTLDPAVRLAYNTMLKETQAEVIKRTIELNNSASGMTKDQRLQAQAAIDVLERKLHQFSNVLVPARTQDGRNLVFHRITAERTFSRPFWEAKVKRMMSLPPNVDLPEDVAIPLNKAITGGQAAEQQQQEAQKEFDANPTPANAAKKKKADEDVLKARRVFAGQVQQFNKTSRPEAILALWKAGLLTNPAARFADAGSNAAFAALEKLASVPASWVDAALGGDRTVLSQLRPESLSASAGGLSEGMKAARKQLGDVLRGEAETNQTTINRFDLRKQFDIDLGQSGAGKATAKGLKKYVEGVYGVQQATDMPFRQAAYRMGMEEQARLAAMREVKAGKLPASGVDARTKELVANPTDAMKTEAEFMENFMAFAEDNWGAKGFNAFKAAAAKMPGGNVAGHIMDVVFPFVKIPTNVFRRVLEYSPVGAIQGGAGIAAAKIANKALDPAKKRLYSQLVGRGSIGSALMLLGWSAASKGLMSGIRDDKDQEGRAQDEAAGRPQGAFKVGNKWVQLGRISPLGNMLISGASLYQQGDRILKDPSERLGRMGGTMLKSVADMPFLMGGEMLLDALNNPVEKGGAYISRQIGSVIPTGIRRIAATVDPVQRDLKDEGMFSDLVAGIPGVSRKFEPRRDVMGRQVPQPGLGPLGPLLDPVRTVTGYDDPASRAIVEHQMKLSKLQKKEGEDKATYGRRAELAGILYQQGILEALQSPEYAEATTKEEKREVLQDGREAGGRLLSEMTTRNEEWKTSTEAQRRMLLDTYLDQVRAMAGR